MSWSLTWQECDFEVQPLPSWGCGSWSRCRTVAPPSRGNKWVSIVEESTGTLRQSTGWSKKPSSCGEWGSSIIRWSAPALRSTPSSLQSFGPLSLFYFSLFSESYPFKLPLIKYWWWRAHLLSIFAISLLEIGERREDFWSPLEYGK